MSQGKAKKISTLGMWFSTCAMVAVGMLGCSGRYYPQNALQGYEYCVAASENSQAVVQSMEIFVRRSPSNPTMVEVDIRPDSVLENGVLVSIYLANQGGQFRVLEPQIPIEAGQEYYLGSYPDTLYEGFDLIVVTPYEPGSSFLDANGTNTAVCYRPKLGDGLDQFGNPSGGP